MLATEYVFDRLSLFAVVRDDEVVWPDVLYLDPVGRKLYEVCEGEGEVGKWEWSKIDALAVKKLFHEYGDDEIED